MKTELSQKPVWSSYKQYKVTSELFLDLIFCSACNCKCDFCIARTNSFAKDNYENWQKALKKALCTFDVKNIIILGGEATIDKRFFERLDYLEGLIDGTNVENVILTTNGIKLRENDFLERLLKTCVNTVNISYMHHDKAVNDKIFKADTLTIAELKNIYTKLKACGKTMRINTNVYRGNLDCVAEMQAFADCFNGSCDYIKFSPLMDTDMFDTVESVESYTKTNAICDDEIRVLYDAFANANRVLEQSSNILGFVDYSLLDCSGQPVILKYAQVEDKYDRSKIIPTLKLYPNGNLANEWDYKKNIL